MLAQGSIGTLEPYQYQTKTPLILVHCAHKLESTLRSIAAFAEAQYSSRTIQIGHLPMSDEPLKTLEVKLDELLRQCSRLQQENTELKQREEDWQRERVRLVEKNELARSRVEAMISRLKSLEAE